MHYACCNYGKTFGLSVSDVISNALVHSGKFELKYKNRARGNRKTLNWPKKVPKRNFRNLKLKSHEEYLICSKHFVQQSA